MLQAGHGRLAHAGADCSAGRVHGGGGSGVGQNLADGRDVHEARRQIARDPEALNNLRIGQYLRYDIPGQLFARKAAELGCEVWKYEFDWSAPESIYDACHCLELPFLFGNFDAWDAPFLAGGKPEEMDKLKDTLQAAWGCFFRGETPAETVWPKYEPDSWQIRIFDNIQDPVGTEPDYSV